MKRLTTVLKTLSGLFVFALVVNCIHVSANSGSDKNDGTTTLHSGTDASAFVVDPDPSININERSIKAGLLYDADNKKIVWQKEMNKELPIASLTKMMVALLAIEDIHAGKIRWDDNVRWTRETLMRINGKNKNVYTQASYSVKDLFKAAMIASNNECAEALARYLEANDLQAALDRMNLRAKELGMNNTWYGNPTGLPAAHTRDDNHSTPADLLLLALEMIKYPDILQVTGMGYADVSDGDAVNLIHNHNHLTIDYSGDVDGMKTGYTRHAGFCLVATSKKCDHRLISIALGANAPGVRNDIVADMINQYYITVGEERLTAVCHAPVGGTTYAVKEDEEGGAGILFMTKSVRTVHVITKGETLSGIARTYDCSLADIAKWNHMSASIVRPGKKLIVYTKMQMKADSLSQAEMAANVETPVAKTVTKKKTVHPEGAGKKYAVYVVQPGDTLATIAHNYNGVTVQQLKTANRLQKGHILRVGSKLRVPLNS